MRCMQTNIVVSSTWKPWLLVKKRRWCIHQIVLPLSDLKVDWYLSIQMHEAATQLGRSKLTTRWTWFDIWLTITLASRASLFSSLSEVEQVPVLAHTSLSSSLQTMERRVSLSLVPTLCWHLPAHLNCLITQVVPSIQHQAMLDVKPHFNDFIASSDISSSDSNSESDLSDDSQPPIVSIRQLCPVNTGRFPPLWMRWQADASLPPTSIWTCHVADVMIVGWHRHLALAETTIDGTMAKVVKVVPTTCTCVCIVHIHPCAVWVPSL